MAYISIGSNVNKEKNIPACLKLLKDLCAVKSASSVYETTPVGNSGDETFLNAAVVIETPLLPGELKETLLDVVEKKLGRKRRADKNAPRTIDLDLSLFNQWVFTLGGRKIPDPEILKFPYIAIPLAEAAPEYIHPVIGKQLSEIANSFRSVKGIKRREDICTKIKAIML